MVVLPKILLLLLLNSNQAEVAKVIKIYQRLFLVASPRCSHPFIFIPVPWTLPARPVLKGWWSICRRRSATSTSRSAWLSCASTEASYATMIRSSGWMPWSWSSSEGSNLSSNKLKRWGTLFFCEVLILFGHFLSWYWLFFYGMEQSSAGIRFDLKTVDYLRGIKYLYFTFTFFSTKLKKWASICSCFKYFCEVSVFVVTYCRGVG